MSDDQSCLRFFVTSPKASVEWNKFPSDAGLVNDYIEYPILPFESHLLALERGNFFYSDNKSRSDYPRF